MSRRRLLAIVLLTVAGALATAAEPPPSFGVVFNDDADLAFVVPDRAKAEALLRANIGALADTPVRTLVYCLGMGGDVLYYDTRVASRVGWRKSPDEVPGSPMAKRIENARVCLAQGADAVRTAGETAKRIGLRFIPSLRMNDAHFVAKPDEHPMTSEFWFKHRDRYTIRESPFAFHPPYGNLLDYSHEAVRRLRLDTVYEALARNRDLVDGFELDFNRFQVFFPKGRAGVGAPLITDLVRQVRRRLDQLGREVGRPLYLFVRVPPSSTDCAAAGLEIETWIREQLVDLVSPAQVMTLAWDMPIADLVALGRRHGVVVYPSLYPRTSWRLPFPTNAGAKRYEGAKVSREATLEEIRGAAAVYRAMGVDGFYLFNFYNAFGSSRPHDEFVYRVLRDLARPEDLIGQSRVFAVTKSYFYDGPGSYAYGKQLPAKLGGDGRLRVTLNVAADPATSPFLVKTCELRLGFRGLPAAARVTVRMNDGPALAAGAARFSTRAITKSASRQSDVAGDYLHWVIAAPERVKSGENAVEIAVAGDSAAIVVTDLELRYEYENDPARLGRW